MDFTVEHIDKISVRVPFRDIPDRNMQRELPHWQYVEIIEVELASGCIGYGETMLFKTWSETPDKRIRQSLGESAVDLMWDDSLGAGLQMALFDAVGRTLNVPTYDLLGSQVRDRVPVSWWCIDMSPDDWLAEAELALDAGYSSIKLKGRPWFDIREQLEVLCRILPDWFSIDIDFNSTLINADRAIPLLKELLDEYPQISHIEGPIPQKDLGGNRRITEAITANTALHYGRPTPGATLGNTVCDGLVVNGGASAVRDAGLMSTNADKPFWLQQVGTGITAAFSTHCSAVLENATWPAINCHQIFENDLLIDSLPVKDGLVSVSDSPGLGVEVDQRAVDRYRIEKPNSQPYPARLIETDWDSGPTIYFSGNDNQMLYYCQKYDNVPYFDSGVTTQRIPDDDSNNWQELYKKAVKEPIVREDPIF